MRRVDHGAIGLRCEVEGRRKPLSSAQGIEATPVVEVWHRQQCQSIIVSFLRAFLNAVPADTSS